MDGIDRGQPVEVNIGDCRCPGDPRPHPDGDLVYLRPVPDLTMGLAATSALRQSGNLMGDTEAAMYSVFVRYGVVAWNVVDATGPVRVTHDAILSRLEWVHGGAIVASRAAELYRDTVLAPLVPTRSAPSRPTRSNGLMSPNPASGQRTRNSRSRSSPSEPVAGT